MAGNALAVSTERLDCLDMRARGCSYVEISSQLRIPIAKVRSHVASALSVIRAATKERVEEVRELERMRLDKMYEKIEPGIQEGILDNIETGLKIMARRAKLDGLEAPVEINQKLTVAHLLVAVPTDVEGARDLLRRELGDSF